MDTKASVEIVTSKDGTQIAYEKSGAGPALILVLGAFNDRAAGAALAQSLQPYFTVFNYDRRGRGDSTDTLPYAIEREIEDVDALIEQAGGSAFVFGYSSGAILSLRAAAYGLAIRKLALYDPPPTGGKAWSIAGDLTKLVQANRRGEAVELFQTEAVGIPAEVVANLRHAPFRPALEAMAHTLVYESTILSALPDPLIHAVKIPTLVLSAERMPPSMHESAQALVKALPQGRNQLLKGQTHDIVPDVVAPLLRAFFESGS